MVFTPHSASASRNIGAYASFPTCMRRLSLNYRVHHLVKPHRTHSCTHQTPAWPTKNVWYPSFAAAAAWLAPCAQKLSHISHEPQANRVFKDSLTFPPGWTLNPEDVMVSPGLGSLCTSATRSALMLPATKRGLMPPAEFMLPTRRQLYTPYTLISLSV